MDCLQGMNRVITHIEENLHQPISYESIARIVNCSVYEFSRIFSLMAGISVSEYIRRRRLSQAVFDIQNTDEKIIDIALRYGYESPNTFARAFKELHGTTPSDARHANVTLKTYPPISFVLTIKGVNEMQFRIEKTKATTLYGVRTLGIPTSDAIIHTRYHPMKDVQYDDEVKRFDNIEDFEAQHPGESVKTKLGKQGPYFYYVTVSPKHTGWQGDMSREVTAYDFALKDGFLCYLTGGEAASSNDTRLPDINWKTQALPPATWAVFPLDGLPHAPSEALSHMYTRIQTEWFPTSGYRRDETIPHLEIKPGEDSLNQPWEIWMPVVPK